MTVSRAREQTRTLQVRTSKCRRVHSSRVAPYEERVDEKNELPSPRRERFQRRRSAVHCCRFVRRLKYVVRRVSSALIDPRIEPSATSVVFDSETRRGGFPFKRVDGFQLTIRKSKRRRTEELFQTRLNAVA